MEMIADEKLYRNMVAVANNNKKLYLFSAWMFL